MKKKNHYKPLLPAIILFSCSILLNASVRLPRLIGDGMVLQRNAPLNIWGWADPGEKVKIEFIGNVYEVKADKQGNWKAGLPACTAGGPYVMKINNLEIKDILIGDVWLCSGQSNMELMIYRVLDLYQNEIEQTDNPNIRYFKPAERNESSDPQVDFKGGKWLPATQENIMNFSSLSYFFGAELYRKYKVPIGLINNAIGGSAIESWLSEDYLRPYMDKWLTAKARVDSLRSRTSPLGSKGFDFNAELAREDPGVGLWSKENVDVSGWPEVYMPGYWSEKGIDLKMGSIWLYREFDIPDSLVGKSAVLRLGRIIESDSSFLNGTFVGTISYQYPPRIYELPNGILKPGKNKLMVRVICQGGKCGFVEDKTYELRVGAQKIDLTGEWNYHIGASFQPPVRRDFGEFPGVRPAGLFNTLTSPVLNYRIKGVIWYQGESNTNTGLEEYHKLFKDLITCWRSKFGQSDMPFLFAQIANLGVPNKQPAESGMANVREAQRRTLELPNTGMAVTYDLGEWNDIHPLNKKEVARRLALEAFRVAYNDSTVVSSGPLFDSMEISGNSIVLTFKSVGEGLYSNSLLDGFQVAGADGRFYWAKAVVVAKDKVKVLSSQVTNPSTVRYAWDDNPAFANLKNKEGLPAAPFVTSN